MPRTIFVNLPVADLDRAVAFYEAVGFTPDPRFREEGAGAALSYSDTINFMLLSHARYADFTTKAVPDTSRYAQMLLCLAEDSREAVDAMMARAVAAGARADPSPIEDYGWMYGRSFEDVDGHMIGVTWINIEAAMAAMHPAGPAVAA